jgi:hypothetical protein
MPGKQLTKEQITKRLQESQERYLRRYCEESRKELWEQFHAEQEKNVDKKKPKEMEIISTSSQHK